LEREKTYVENVEQKVHGRVNGAAAAAVAVAGNVTA
jgi:hypothetical protein